MATVIINDSNWRDFRFAGGGLITRNFDEYPQGCYEGVRAFDMPLIPVVEMAERIREQEATKSSLQHIRDVGANGQPIPYLDQRNYGYCWAHSTIHAAMLLRAAMGLPYVPLSAYAVAAIIKNYRDQGGWCQQSLDFIRNVGAPSQAKWPQGRVDRSLDTPEMRADAGTRKITEWYDLTDNQRNRPNSGLMKHQVATLLLSNIPVMLDYNWWSHSVCGVRLISWEPFKVRILNSHANFGDNGMADLLEGKAVPNNAAAPAVANISK